MKIRATKGDVITQMFFFMMATVSVLIAYLVDTSVSISDNALLAIHAAAVLVGVFEFFYAVVKIRRYEQGKRSLFLYFLISFYVFLMSQQILYLFGFEVKQGNIYNLGTLKEVTVATHYTNMYISGMLCGAFYFKSNAARHHIAHFGSEEEEIKFTNKTLFYCRILFWVSILPALYYIVFLYKEAQISGYDAIFENSANLLLRASSYFEKFAILSLFGFILLDNRTLVKCMSYAAIIAVSIIFYMMGDRAFPTALLLAVVWIYTNSAADKKLLRSGGRGIRYLVGGVVVVGLVFLFPLIHEARGGRDGLLSFDMLAEVYRESGASLITSVLESIGTLGFSASSLMYTMRFVPGRYSFRFGTTYFWAWTMVIPNILSPLGISHIGAKQASLSQWLMNVLNIEWGPGYSMVAEAYINFGWFAFPAAVLIGYIFARVLTPKISNVTKNYSKYHLLICIGIFINCISMPRRDLGNPLRDLMYTILPLQILMFIYRRNERKNNQSRQ